MEAKGLSLRPLGLGAWEPTVPGRVWGEREGKGGREARLRVSPDCVQGFPIIFHGVMGKDEREGNSPSFFNPEEAATVTSYLKQLLISSSKKGKGRLSPRNVGVISPYRKQVRPSIPIEGDTHCTHTPWYLIRRQTTRWRFRSSGLCSPHIWEAQRSAAPPCVPSSCPSLCASQLPGLLPDSLLHWGDG